MNITRRNAISGDLESREIPITQEQWHRFLMGESIYKVMPELSTNDKRFIIYGVNERQYADMFGE